MVRNLVQTWDLDVFFPGGSGSKEFADFLDRLEKDLVGAMEMLRTLRFTSVEDAVRGLNLLQDISGRLRHAGAFVSCLSAQNVHDKNARVVGARVRQLQAEFSAVMTKVDQLILSVPEVYWKMALNHKDIRPIAFNLNERRERAKEMLPPEQETLATALATDGYHGWSDLYDLTTGRMSIKVKYGDKELTLSPGQAANRMSDKDPELRKAIMDSWEKSWAEQAEFCALALNHLAGFRLSLYQKRGWTDFLKEPLELNRMTAQTLEAMWTAVNGARPRLATYLDRKKRLLGLSSLGWQDVDAPVGSADSRMTYDDAATFIVDNFRKFSPRMAQFAEKAFSDRWIEAEDRPGKRMGGFCTSFPVKKQSRIFVTFSGTPSNVATLAHELGHGFHQSLMTELPQFAQNYAMNVAETASTFAEMLVGDAAVKAAKDPAERMALVEDKLRRAVGLFMNIQSRFLFETRFYEARKRGLVSVEKLNELMTNAQKEAFAGCLDLYHPHFWASKLHFYNTRVPFYNFPYTFGFLFSAGVYGRALEEGPKFEPKYAELLRDTGRMRVEDLARKHLGVDLMTPAFWESAVDIILADLNEFLDMTAGA